jgi:hypothetical protein
MNAQAPFYEMGLLAEDMEFPLRVLGDVVHAWRRKSPTGTIDRIQVCALHTAYICCLSCTAHHTCTRLHWLPPPPQCVRGMKALGLSGVPAAHAAFAALDFGHDGRVDIRVAATALATFARASPKKKLRFCALVIRPPVDTESGSGSAELDSPQPHRLSHTDIYQVLLGV